MSGRAGQGGTAEGWVWSSFDDDKADVEDVRNDEHATFPLLPRAASATHHVRTVDGR